MPATIQVDGLASIKTATPTGGSLILLGYSINGVEITERVYTLDVNSDENGGDAGPPIDVQYMGEMHQIRMLMPKYDVTEIDKIRAVLASGTAGTPGTAGTLMFTAVETFRLLIHTVSRPRNYLNCIFREVREINKGTKHSQALVVASCYKDGNGLLYNAVVV